MRLQLHVGTEKTGSSYLQTLCGKNRQFLQENGLWFPDAGMYEKQLQQGEVSPGNGLELGEHICSNSWPKVIDWIKVRVNEAERRGCHSLLLSYELLFAGLSTEGAMENFQSAAAAAGISETSFLLMIRDPVDQALSLYKHRAKSGRLGDIEEWIKNRYSIPRQIDDFLGQVDQSRVQIHVRKYVKNTAALIDVFFHDWLGVDEPPKVIQSYVNQSLSLSELAVIQHIVTSRPGDQRAFYAKFLALSRDLKADEQSIEIAIAAKVENHLCQYNSIWTLLDTRLVSDGGIVIPQPRVGVIDDARQYSFSEAQIQAWCEAHAQSARIRYILKTQIHRIGIGILVRNISSRFRNIVRNLLGQSN